MLENDRELYASRNEDTATIRVIGIKQVDQRTCIVSRQIMTKKH